MPDPGSEIVVVRVRPDEKRAVFQYLCMSDGSLIGPFHMQTVSELGIRVGMSLASEEVADLYYTERVRTVKETAMRYLGSRSSSARDLRRHLAKQHPEHMDVIGQVVAWCEERKLIDDLSFGERVATRWAEEQRGSRQALRRKLAAKGVTPIDAKRVLHAVQVDEWSAACRVARRKLEQIDRKLSYDAQEDVRETGNGFRRRKRQELLIAYLSRQGYARETVLRVVQQLTEVQFDWED